MQQRQKQRLEEMDGVLKLGFVQLSEKPDQGEGLYPVRKTRMHPLRYWLGETIAYKDHVAKGYYVAEKM
jgi:hypothetical protein